MATKINKTYHILINTMLTTNTTTWNSNLCFFDWEQLPKSRWKVKMYLQSNSCNFNSNQVIQVFADFSQNNNELVRNSSGALPTTNKDYKDYLGTVIGFTNRASNFNIFYSRANDNGATYLDATPTNNLFNLYLYNHGVGQGLFSPNVNGNAALIGFSFEMLDDPIYRTIQTSYKIVFNSDYAEKNVQTGNSLGNLSYYFDWTQLKQGEYLVSCSLFSSDDPLATNPTYYNYGSNAVYADIGQGNSSVFHVKSSIGAGMRDSNFLCLAPFIRPASIFPIVSFNDMTPPIFLNKRPTNNFLNIYIYTLYSPQYPFGRPTGTLMNYTLVMNFKWLGEKY